jgi:starch synthase (maltosyl-transferring)
MQERALRGEDEPVDAFWGDAGKKPQRVVIEAVTPAAEWGHPLKRVLGDTLRVEADIFTDGHDELCAVLVISMEGACHHVPMQPLGNDRWVASCILPDLGAWELWIEAWRDIYYTWTRDVEKKRNAGQSVDVELQELIAVLKTSSAAAGREVELARLIDLVAGPGELTSAKRVELLSQHGVRQLVPANVFKRHACRSETTELWVERRRAVFGAWYELMPRSQASERGRHGTFADVAARLPDLKELGFDVLYLTPIHPIGRTNRKGRNNSLSHAEDDPGSPYAIGAEEGGHEAVHPQLGTIDDFKKLIASAKHHGMEIALDFAIQCSPDHPWIREHRDWFDWRPDGSLCFAENPPKRYEDIVSVSFYGPSSPDLWKALRDVVLFWVDKGVTIFRVDNPHTKPFPFWHWLIREVRQSYPEVIFLSEAFTRPKIMLHLAKLGFTQSYSYFTWRNTKHEITEYILELMLPQVSDFMRVNFFTNTPDINPYYLQTGGRAAFQVRLFLAATLGTNYGIYSGFELCEAAALPGKEEYLDSEKYEIKPRDWHAPGNIRDDIRRLNALRKCFTPLQSFVNVRFYNAWNDNILYFGKTDAEKRQFLLFAVNLDPHKPQGAHFEVPLWEFDLPDHASIEVVDLIRGARFWWTGKVQHMWLDPKDRPYAVWRLIPPGDNG